jgi:Nudix hydrolase domain
MANAFRSAANLGGRSRSSGRRFGSSPCSSRIPAESLFRRTSAAGVAVLAALSSATALASHRDNSYDNTNTNTHFGLVNGKSRNLTTAYCEEEQEQEEVCFPETLLTFDHYNGVIVHLDRMFAHDTSNTEETLDQESIGQRQLYQQLNQDPEVFQKVLETSLRKWKAQGKKGIWIHLPRAMAAIVPVSTQ